MSEQLTDIIEAFRRVAPAESARVEGASDASVDRVSHLMGHALPHDYRRFLSWAGGDPNPLFHRVPFDLRISVVEDYYRQTLENWPDTLPEGHVVIGLDRLANAQISLALSASEPCIVYTYDEEIGERLHDGLPEMLRHHIQRHRVARWRTRVELDIPPMRLGSGRARLEGVAEALGLSVRQGTDSMSWLASNERVDVIGYQFEDIGGWMKVGGSSPTEVKRVAGRLCETLGASIRPATGG